MPGFDWNGNGKSDTFDHFIDMKVTFDVYDNNDSRDFDDVYFDTDDLDLGRTELIRTLRKVSPQRHIWTCRICL